MKHLIFVYGTLKRGFSRHSVLKDQRYIGIGVTTNQYSMYAYGGFPALVENSNGLEIYGELYEVDDNCIQDLDKIEGVDKGLFSRNQINLSNVTFVSLPTDLNVWKVYNHESSSVKWIAESYFFKKSTTGAADCGRLWTQK
jgi:gamma-glutamylcyclotransferase (GGCT)/AIG2-like uncharacterized protein YtfP